LEIVLDEWIVHFIADPAKQKETGHLLTSVFRKCDRFVTVAGSPLAQKLYEMCKGYRRFDSAGRALAKMFIMRFLDNSEKLHRIPTDVAAVPEDLTSEVKEDDRYLVRAALATRDKLILTTDGPLKEALDGKHGIRVRLVDEFVEEYNP